MPFATGLYRKEPVLGRQLRSKLLYLRWRSDSNPIAPPFFQMFSGIRSLMRSVSIGMPVYANYRFLLGLKVTAIQSVGIILRSCAWRQC